MIYGVIVDGYSSGAELVYEFKKLGIHCLHVQSQETIPDIYVKTFNATAYAKTFIFAGDLSKLCQELKAHNPIFVITGSEPGVELADQIGNALKLSNCNSIETSEFRRNKFLMHERLKAKKLAHIPQCKSSSLEKLLTWGEPRLKKRALVIKPLKSAGGDRVKICHTKEDIIAGFNEIMTPKPNMLGLIDKEVLLQDYIDSSYPEIAVNTMHYEGRGRLCEIWEFHKRLCYDNRKIYDYADLKFPSPYHPKLMYYALKVAHALDIQYGPMHAEILITPRGYVLIEAAARLMGANIPACLMHECLTHPQIWMMALAYGSPEEYQLATKASSRLLKHVRVVFLISTISGNFVKINHLNKIKSLASFYDIKIRLTDRVFVTTDYDTSPGLIYLCHENEEILQQDYQTIRELEKSMYEVL